MRCKLLFVQIVYLFSVSGMAKWQVVNIYIIWRLEVFFPTFPNLFCCHKIMEHKC